MAAVAHFPWTLDKDLLDRARRPLATIVVMLLAIDLIGLGLRLADAGESPLADTPMRAKARIGAPDAVVPGSSVFGSETERRRAAARSGQPAQPAGCLALNSGCYPGDTTTPGPTGGSPPAGPTAPQPDPVPVAQADLAVPALGTQVSLGVGDGSCTSVVLTAIALGDCPVESGDGPVVLNLGGSLLGD